MRRRLLVLGLLPVVAMTVLAGVISSPSDARPCLVEYSEGITGGPTHLILGPEGDLYATEEVEKRILRFDPDTHEATEYDVRVPPHDLTAGPDGRIWFVSAAGRDDVKQNGGDYLGALDPETGEVTFYPGISDGAEPHQLRWNFDGRLYITEQKAGRLAIFDPQTETIVEDAFGLPKDNYIHDIVVLPNGDIWAVLQGADKLARFNLEKQQFDRFVDVPVRDSGPRDITYVRSENAIYATLFAANQLAVYDLDTQKLTLYKSHFAPITYAAAVSLNRREPKLTFVRPDAQEDAVWVATLAGGELLRFDLATQTFKRVGCGVTLPAAPLGIATDEDGRLWVAEPFPGRIAEVKQ
jgi:streptogramin lyase